MSSRLPSGVYEHLHRRIVSGELPPHSRIKEEEIALLLGISRTPVREALAKLETDGLIKRTPRKGAVVCQVELDEVDEIYQIRDALETLVAIRACERATEDEVAEMGEALGRAEECLRAGSVDEMSRNTLHFHALLNRASRSPRLVRMLRTLEDRLTIFRYRGLRLPGRSATVMKQHWGILEGLRRRDTAAMTAWIHEHAEAGRMAAIKTHLEEGRNRRMADSGR